jgi:hypothetical protein
MSEARRELEESWARTTGHLLAGLACLSPIPRRSDCDDRVHKFREWLDHNELELALDELEALGDLLRVRGAFWEHLLLAATEMKLDENAQRLREKRAG